MSAGTGSGAHIVILSRSARETGLGWGLGADAKILESTLRAAHATQNLRIASIDHIDPMKFCGSGRLPKHVDITFHLEIPCRVAFQYSKKNVAIVNSEWWPRHDWDWCLDPKTGADLFVFKTRSARDMFPEIPNERVALIPWRCDLGMNSALSSLPKFPPVKEFLYLLGGSVNKTIAARSLVRAWKPSWPKLHIIGASELLDSIRFGDMPVNITMRTPYMSVQERINAQTTYAFHIVASAAESFAHPFAEAISIGAIPLWNSLLIYDELYGELLGNIGRIASSVLPSGRTDDVLVESEYRTSLHSVFPTSSIESAVESVLAVASDTAAYTGLVGTLRHFGSTQIKTFRTAFFKMLRSLTTAARSTTTATGSAPAEGAADTPPSVAVITLVHNRPQWFPNAAQNILRSSYPRDKLTWIIVDDSPAAGRIDGPVAAFQSRFPQFQTIYVSLPRKHTIGEKRNIGCSRAPAEATVFVMMDDDDHYPAVSIEMRVRALKALGRECVYCSVLPMYDTVKYISAVNVPPLTLSPYERISEASMAFTRAFWSARGWPTSVNIAEGSAFLSDRLEATAEIPPEGVIISFLHVGNTTSRRIPESETPNGCHYGFDDTYFTLISEAGQKK
jgi:hypothetical protein